MSDNKETKQAKRGNDEQILTERKLTCEAINGAMAFGYHGTNPPPRANHWLAPYWNYGARMRELEQTKQARAVDAGARDERPVDPDDIDAVSEAIQRECGCEWEVAQNCAVAAIDTLIARGNHSDALPKAIWTRHGSGVAEWWSFKGYECHKGGAGWWIVRKGGKELYRHTYLQVVMAHAERAILDAAPQPASEQQPVPQLFADTGDAVRGTFGKTVFAGMSNSYDLWPVWLDGWLGASEQQAARVLSDEQRRILLRVSECLYVAGYQMLSGELASAFSALLAAK